MSKKTVKKTGSSKKMLKPTPAPKKKPAPPAKPSKPVKPKASRDKSSETFLVGIGLKEGARAV